MRWGLTWYEAWRISPRSLRLYCRARFHSWQDYLRLETIAAFHGQVFHGRLMSKDGLKSSAIDDVMPRRKQTAEEKRAERDDRLAASVMAMGGKVRRAGASDG